MTLKHNRKRRIHTVSLTQIAGPNSSNRILSVHIRTEVPNQKLKKSIRYFYVWILNFKGKKEHKEKSN